MVYEDGTVASASKCPDCNGRGWSPCSRCKNGRRVCADCSGKGILKKPPSSCPACGGSRKLSCAACGPAPDAGPAAADATSGGTAEDSEANAVVLRNALSFLLGCGRTPSGAFALRDRSKGTTAGALRKPSHYSNSQVAWTLLVAGIAPDNPGMARAMKVLEEEGRMIADGRIPDAGVQATAFTLRALLVGGRGPGDPLVEKLADRLVEAQRPSGLWNYALDGTGGDDNILDSLIAVEALHVARTRGLRISRSVWSKAFRAASSEFGSRGPAGARRGDLSAIDVVSNLALLVIAKAGSLGDEAGTFDYHSLPDVRAGLAWLDRHFSIVDHPDFRAGARLHPDGGGAYFAHLFALQRLAMLLSIDELGGQRWHVTGSRHIRGLQRQDGSFEERGPAAANWSVRSSCFAVLFLLRATTPITQQGEAK